MSTNTTMNGTRPSSCFNPRAEKIGKTFAYCALIVVSLAGNTLIGIIVYKTKTMRRPTNFFIVNMAMSDLLFPIFLFLWMLTGLYTDFWPNSNGPLGNALCKLYPLLPIISFTVSIQSLVLIAVDRFGAVVFPFRSPLISSKLCPFFILATWIVALAFYTPYFFVFKLVEYPQGLVCALQWNKVFGKSSSFKNYVLAIFVTFLFIPVMLLAILYITIILKLRSQTVPGEQSVKNEQQRVKRERNVLKMTIAIVLWFAVCWLPYSVIDLLHFFEWDNTKLSCSIKHLRYITKFLPYANCTINPCICFIFSGNYRQGLKSLLRCPFVHSKRKQGTPRQVRNNNQQELVLTKFVQLNK
ncbi:QRFP-like peptide receptor [Oculina patagonica]